MPEIKLPEAHKVIIVESECGWGQKIDEIKFFSTADDAKKFVLEFNKQNTAPTAPDWYMYAEYCGRVS